ncbi:TetR/AcrR family transcriptional regulator [Paenibacillus macerans]|uniref:TetR/AcrR family transcriptional regulator n=1 Tax=Paenibacillus macerans TaxID=44252 RepID=UPI00203D791C|nr:TetR/AcrR family transcriptional regulator [Paenibacillus macerans]MCM3702109.1 TetR/AcrR family transcriptional regulator [Paenibacillus macerans]
MGTQERRQKEQEIRRNDIIEAAEKVFFEKGYHSATMDDVAKAAEFSKRTVYIYFTGKEQIYFEIMIRGYRRLIGMLQEDLQNGDFADAIEAIRQMGWTMYRFNRTFPDYFKAIMEYETGERDFQKGIPDASKEECYALGEEIMETLIGLLKKGIAEGSVRADLDPAKTALVLWACIIGVFNTASKKEKYIQSYYGTTAEELVSESVALMISSIQSGRGGDPL